MNNIKEEVKKSYGKIATGISSCCGSDIGCCGSEPQKDLISKSIGYDSADLNSVPEGANLGLGCGNPLADSEIMKGDTVLDLGSGAGFDCFLASKKTGLNGKVIGVDMTPQMIDKAEWNKQVGNYENVEFRLGEIEKLPVDDKAVDLIISNCVINLSPDKKAVFSEAFRVLADSGKLLISDIVLTRKLPESVLNSVAAYTGCIAGAEMKDNYINLIKSAGFRTIEILEERIFPLELMSNDPAAQEIMKESNISKDELLELGSAFASVKVRASK